MKVMKLKYDIQNMFSRGRKKVVGDCAQLKKHCGKHCGQMLLLMIKYLGHLNLELCVHCS